MPFYSDVINTYSTLRYGIQRVLLMYTIQQDELKEEAQNKRRDHRDNIDGKQQKPSSHDEDTCLCGCNHALLSQGNAGSNRPFLAQGNGMLS